MTANQITVLLDPAQIPNRQVQDQQVFDNLVAAMFAALPTFGAQLNGVVANLNSIAAGGAYAIPYTWAPANSAGAMCTSAAASESVATGFDINNVSLSGNVLALLQQFDASGSSVKGTIRIQKQNDQSAWLVFSVTGRTDNGTYQHLSGSVVAASSATPFNTGDSVMLFYQRSGDKGDAGALTPVLWVRDEKASGTNAGEGTAGGTAQRTLNTVKKNTISGASLSANQVTLPAGTYRMSMSVPYAAGGASKAWIYSVTDSAVLATGLSAFGTGSSIVMNCEVVLSATKVIEVRQYTSSNSGTGISLGAASSTGQTEVYTELFIEKAS